VAEAQSREAPVQRLADAVAGRFCYGVMAASALTFAFWQLIGERGPLWLSLLLVFGWRIRFGFWVLSVAKVQQGSSEVNPHLTNPTTRHPPKTKPQPRPNPTPQAPTSSPPPSQPPPTAPPSSSP